MKSEEFMDVYCVLLCKSFQGKQNSRDSYLSLYESLKKEIGETAKQYSVFGEYDGVFSVKIKNKKNSLLKDIESNNRILAKQMSDSIFFKSIYLIYPANEKYTEETDKFWNADSSFFLMSIIHMNYCCANLDVKKSGREYIIRTIDDKKQQDDTKWNFRYRVYYSLDLSDYIIVWKTEEPAHVLEAIRHLYETSDLIGYTNTICTLPTANFSNIDNVKKTVGKTHFSMSIQAVAKSYSEAQAFHSSVMESMNGRHKIDSLPSFSMGNDDYFGFFPDVSPAALYDLYDVLINAENFDKAILSLNTTLAIDGYTRYRDNNANVDSIISKFDEAKEFKDKLMNACYHMKEEYLDLFKNNSEVFDCFFWKKTLMELLILLDNMSKSTVFDSACFLFLDSANLFLSFIKYLRNKYSKDEDLICALTENELHIETFIREWEQLINHVVQIDGAFQKTPGYEPLNYNVSESIVEFHNAFAQKLIRYFSSLDRCITDEHRSAKISSFVVPKLCRRFKTTQWFYDNRKSDSLLFITIPVDQIFKTFSNMVALTHEICHYCSNDIRNRTCRTDTLLLNLSSLICSYLQIYSNKTVNAAYEIIKSLFEEANEGNYDCYISDLATIAKNIAFRFLDKVDNLNRLFYVYLKDYEEEYGEPLKDKSALAMKIRRTCMHLISLPNLHSYGDYSDFCSIYSLIDDLILLIKEGYADLMMIYVLSLNPEQYLKESLRELNRLNSKTESKKVFSKYQRVLVVSESLIKRKIWTKEQFITLKSKLNGIDIYDDFLEVFISRCENKSGEADYWDFFFNDDILDTIVCYLCNCLNSIDIAEKEQGVAGLRSEISMLFDVMTSGEKEGLFSELFQNELQDNRKQVLDKWFNKEKNPYIFE